MANRLVLHPAGVVHFHLKTYFTSNKIRQDLSEEAFNQTSLTVPPIFCYHLLSVLLVEPLILLNQDRAHIFIRLHWKYTIHERHINPFNPEWQPTSVLLRPLTRYYVFHFQDVGLLSSHPTHPKPHQSTQVVH
jgi:hypothetical protein